MSSQWNYRHFKNTEMKKLETWVNGLNCGAQDIVSAISGNNFHVFAKQGKRGSGYWQHAYEKWDKNSPKNTTAIFNSKPRNRVILGLSRNNFHYLEWVKT